MLRFAVPAEFEVDVSGKAARVGVAVDLSVLARGKKIWFDRQ
jgi:hypothetical protein